MMWYLCIQLNEHPSITLFIRKLFVIHNLNAIDILKQRIKENGKCANKSKTTLYFASEGLDLACPAAVDNSIVTGLCAFKVNFTVSCRAKTLFEFQIVLIKSLFQSVLTSFLLQELKTLDSLGDYFVYASITPHLIQFVMK